MSKAKDPIFAPIVYGDDRQVTRTRRGINSICELKYNPEIVYCKCLSCNYEWEMSKIDYIGGTGVPSTPDMDVANFGRGGTGRPYNWTEYGVYDSYAHECCTGGIGLSAYPGQEILIADYYPLLCDTSSLMDCTSNGIICVDSEGNFTPESLLGWDSITGELTGNTGSPCLGDATSVYMISQGASGEVGPGWKPRTFGGYPLVCPNCCKVNFQALYIEPYDNPGKEKSLTDDDPETEDLIMEPCYVTVIIDFQRIKSHFSVS